MSHEPASTERTQQEQDDDWFHLTDVPQPQKVNGLLTEALDDAANQTWRAV